MGEWRVKIYFKAKCTGEIARVKGCRVNAEEMLQRVSHRGGVPG